MNKLKRPYFLVVCMTSLLLSSLGSADPKELADSKRGLPGAEGRGGGQIIDVESTPELLDLVTKSVCRYESGEEVLGEHPDFENQIIAPLRKLDWYFADTIVKDVRGLRFCFTGPLYRESTADWFSPVKPPSRFRTRQGGFRLGDRVFIDDEVFSSVITPEPTRTYLILHEDLHTFLPMNVEFRKLKLRSVVKTISLVAKGKIKSREKLHYNMRENDIDFPRTVDDLDAYRSQIEFFLADPEEQATRLSQLSEIDSLLDFPDNIKSELTSDDQSLLTEYPPETMVKNAFARVLVSSDRDTFLKLIRSDEFKRIDPLGIAIANLDLLSKENQAALWSGDLQKIIFDRTYGDITNAKLEFAADGRAALDAKGSSALGSSSTKPESLLDIPIPTELSPDLKALADGLVWNVKSGHWDWVSSIAGAQSPLLSVLRLDSIRSQIASANFAYKLETKYADRHIALISQQFFLIFEDYLKSKLTDDEYSRLSEIIFKGAVK